MKYQFNKIFALLIKWERKCWKTLSWPDLGLLGHNLGHNFYFDVSKKKFWCKFAIWYAIVFFNFLQYLSSCEMSTLYKLVNKINKLRR